MTRKMTVMASLLAALIGCAAAKENIAPQTKQKLAKRNYLLALKCEHASIRNSAIFHVMKYQARFPQDDSRPFVKLLRGMSQNDPSPQNRLYSFLACTFLENEKLLQAAGVPPKQEDDKGIYFVRLQEILQNHEALASQ
ncbi:MAG: hypothetical protein ACREOI_27980 [bacterium]